MNKKIDLVINFHLSPLFEPVDLAKLGKNISSSSLVLFF